MRKISLILVLVFLVLGSTFMGWAEEKFQVKPTLYGTFLTTVVIHPKTLTDWKCGFTLLGIDGTIFKCGNWNFLGIGGGVAVHFEKNPGWYYDSGGYYNPYGGYNNPYGGWRWKEYDTEFWFYVKFVPVKYRWDWLSKLLKANAHIELGVTHKKDVVFGLTFSWNPFKKKIKESAPS